MIYKNKDKITDLNSKNKNGLFLSFLKIWPSWVLFLLTFLTTFNFFKAPQLIKPAESEVEFKSEDY